MNMHEIQESKAMANQDVLKYLDMVPAVLGSPNRFLWSRYDTDVDALYIDFKESGRITHSELTDDDIIIRYEEDEMIGLTILHASQRNTNVSQRSG